MSTTPRYIVGIDLGTTHCALAYSPIDRNQIQVMEIPQLTAPGEVHSNVLLPSSLYLPATDELPEESRKLPWGVEPGEPCGISGEFARRRGAQVPNRLCSSAKSWICHGGVDRRAPILPWNPEETNTDLPQVSPLEAEARFLRHMRHAWDALHPNDPLADQLLEMTVPASFDEVARAITLEAAEAAGLPAAKLLEEPKAAFYHFISHDPEQLSEVLKDVSLVLVVDVGGGTTDLTLVHVQPNPEHPDEPQFERIAVGGHLMLGGDNIDAALAQHLQETAGLQSMSPTEWSALVQTARTAKETLLAEGAPEQTTCAIAKRSGRRLIGSSVSVTLTKEDVERIVLEGFFPHATLDAAASPEARSGLTTLGLPYTRETAITKHIGTFLRRFAPAAQKVGASVVQGCAKPDAVLLNGGVFKAPKLITRLMSVLESWFGTTKLLEHRSLDLAVACGAVASGLARLGIGAAITGGSPRMYAIGLGDASEHKALCIVPRGMEEGKTLAVTEHPLEVVLGRQVAFPLYSSTTHTAQPGDLLAVDENLDALPPLVTILRHADRKNNLHEPVTLHSTLSIQGNLQVSLQTMDLPPLHWRLAFELKRETTKAEARPSQFEEPPPSNEPLPKNFNEAVRLIERTFQGSREWALPEAGKSLRQGLEDFLGARGSWSSTVCRALFDVLMNQVERRNRTADHCVAWIRLTGFCLRPGFGFHGDKARLQKMWQLFAEGPGQSSKLVYSEWWILWRRLAPALDFSQQETIYQTVKPYCEPNGKPPKGPQLTGVPEMLRMLSTLETLPPSEKVLIGSWCMAQQKKIGLWPIGRLGARHLLARSNGGLVPVDVVEAWLRVILQDNWNTPEHAFAAAMLSARSPISEISESLRLAAIRKLEETHAPARLLSLVQNTAHMEASDWKQLLGETLPEGLVLSR